MIIIHNGENIEIRRPFIDAGKGCFTGINTSELKAVGFLKLMLYVCMGLASTVCSGCCEEAP